MISAASFGVFNAQESRRADIATLQKNTGQPAVVTLTYVTTGVGYLEPENPLMFGTTFVGEPGFASGIGALNFPYTPPEPEEEPTATLSAPKYRRAAESARGASMTVTVADPVDLSGASAMSGVKRWITKDGYFIGARLWFRVTGDGKTEVAHSIIVTGMAIKLLNDEAMYGLLDATPKVPDIGLEQG